MALGYRDRYTFRKLPVIETLELANQALYVERLVRENRNGELMQFLHEVRNGRRDTPTT